jgi:hypothetical protein
MFASPRAQIRNKSINVIAWSDVETVSFYSNPLFAIIDYIVTEDVMNVGCGVNKVSVNLRRVKL